MYQKLGLTKAEMDENTGNLEEAEAAFRSAVESLEQLHEQVERVRSARRALDEAWEAWAGSYDSQSDVDLAGATIGREEAALYESVVRGWVQSAISARLDTSARVAAVVKQRHDMVLDYFARKRKLEAVSEKAAKAKDASKHDESLGERKAKFEHSKEAVRTVTGYLGPLLETFVRAADECRVQALHCLAAANLVDASSAYRRLKPRTDVLGTESAMVRGLLEDAARGGRLQAPPTEALRSLTVMLEKPPRLSSYAPPPKGTSTRRSSQVEVGAVFFAPLEVLESPPVEALVALLDVLQRRGGLDRQGVFRIPGNTDDVEAIKRRLDARENPATALAEADLDDVATLTKMWFRERAPPGFLDATFVDSLFEVNRRLQDDHSFANALRDLLHADARSPQAYCLDSLLCFLHDVAANSRVNMMTADNLAICFAPNILLTNPNDPTALQPAIALMERIIRNARPAPGDQAQEDRHESPQESVPRRDALSMTPSSRRPVRPPTPPYMQRPASS